MLKSLDKKRVVGLLIKFSVSAVLTILLLDVCVFLMWEFSPSFAQNAKALHSVRYYGQRITWVADEQLIFENRVHPETVNMEFRGDLYDPNYQVDTPAIDYQATYNEYGFRSSSSETPCDVLFIGDSYLEIGEADALTLPELVKSQSGRSTYNLGRNAYGPCQYSVLWDRHHQRVSPKVTVLCFFSGNDVTDVGNYLAFEQGQPQWFVAGGSMPKRFYQASKDLNGKGIEIAKSLVRPIKNWLLPPPPSAPAQDVRDYLGNVVLNEETVPMRFVYWNQKMTTDELLEQPTWKRIASTIRDLDDRVQQSDGKLLVVYIPTKLQVYGSLASQDSGPVFLRDIQEQLQAQDNQAGAMAMITTEASVEFVNLLPEFRSQAGDGKLLYYPFDTHWNSEGRRSAADLISERIDEMLNHKPSGPQPTQSDG